MAKPVDFFSNTFDISQLIYPLMLHCRASLLPIISQNFRRDYNLRLLTTSIRYDFNLRLLASTIRYDFNLRLLTTAIRYDNSFFESWMLFESSH